MSEYDADFQLSAVAQSCGRFTSGRKASEGYRTAGAGISCSSCGNWSGSRCLAKSFDRVMSDLELD